jgi:hypothetical protein
MLRRIFSADFPYELVSTLAHTVGSAEDITWACKPRRRLATASMLPAGAR